MKPSTTFAVIAFIIIILYCSWMHKENPPKDSFRHAKKTESVTPKENKSPIEQIKDDTLIKFKVLANRTIFDTEDDYYLNVTFLERHNAIAPIATYRKWPIGDTRIIDTIFRPVFIAKSHGRTFKFVLEEQ
jgi:hypothetical protein